MNNPILDEIPEAYISHDEPEDSPSPAINRLREIFKELQTPGSITHDQWEWQDAEMCVEVLNALIGALERELVAANLRADSAVHQLEDMRDKRDAPMTVRGEKRDAAEFDKQ
jgi:hypothetical protein